MKINSPFKIQHSTFRRFSVYLLSLLLLSCPEDPEPDPRDTSIYLELESTLTTSLTLKVSVADTSDYWRFSLSRDDTTLGMYTVDGNDTLIKDGDLEPDRDYTYRAYWLDDGEVKDSGNQIIATTMDTTSHHFTWTIDTLGGYGSYLRDVAIVDENNIWVVGNIETDSGQYNAAHWDGNEWELRKIMFAVYYNTKPTYIDNYEVSSVFYLEESNSLYFVCLGALKVFSNLSDWQYIEMEPMNGVPGNAIWGSAPDDVYFVGDNGSIVHYDGGPSQGGQGFERMESGTEVDLYDIWGAIDDNSIWTCGYSIDYSQGSLINHTGNIWTILTDENDGLIEPVYGHLFSSVWLYKSNKLFLSVYSSVVCIDTEDLTVTRAITNPHVGIYKVRGNHEADIMIAGEYGNICHYNGIDWKKYSELADNSIFYRSLDVNSNTVCAVGYLDIGHTSKAVVLRGSR